MVASCANTIPNLHELLSIFKAHCFFINIAGVARPKNMVNFRYLYSFFPNDFGYGML